MLREVPESALWCRTEDLSGDANPSLRPTSEWTVFPVLLFWVMTLPATLRDRKIKKPGWLKYGPRPFAEREGLMHDRVTS